MDWPVRMARPTKVSDVVLDFIDIPTENPPLKFQSELRRADSYESRSSITRSIDE
jgi:hypothetical protein